MANNYLQNDLFRIKLMLAGLLIFVLIEASALWRTGQPAGQARQTAIECATPGVIFFIIGVASVRNFRKQIQSRSSE